MMCSAISTAMLKDVMVTYATCGTLTTPPAPVARSPVPSQQRRCVAALNSGHHRQDAASARTDMKREGFKPSLNSFRTRYPSYSLLNTTSPFLIAITTACVRALALSFRRIDVMWFLIVCSVTSSLSAICLFR